MTNFTYKIERTKSRSGKRNLFFPSLNGKRFSKTNFATKGGAKSLVEFCLEKYGATSKVIQISTTHYDTTHYDTRHCNGNVTSEIVTQALCQDGSIWDRVKKDEWNCILEAHKEPEAKQEQNQTDKIIELQKKIIEKHDNERKKNKEVQEALQELKEAVEKDCWSVGEANIHFGVLKVKAQNLINALGVK